MRESATDSTVPNAKLPSKRSKDDSPSPVKHVNSTITHEFPPNLNLNLSVCSKNYTRHLQDGMFDISYFKRGNARKQTYKRFLVSENYKFLQHCSFQENFSHGKSTHSIKFPSNCCTSSSAIFNIADMNVYDSTSLAENYWESEPQHFVNKVHKAQCLVSVMIVIS